MKQIMLDLQNTIEEIYNSINIEKPSFPNGELLIRLNKELQVYTKYLLINMEPIISSKEWLEILLDCANSIQNKDKVLLFDILEYAIKPQIKQILKYED